MSDSKFATAERATKQIENHTRRAVEVLSNGFNGQIRSAVHFYEKAVLRPVGIPSTPLPCHAGGRGFEARCSCQHYKTSDKSVVIRTSERIPRFGHTAC